MKPHTLKRSTAVTLKSVGDEGTLGKGQFTALVSVFGNVDSLGEVVMPGAFTDTLAQWQAKGDPIPVVWSHQWSDPMSHIGEVLEAKETDQGLEVTAQLDMSNPTAVQVFKLLKDRRVTEFSYAGEESDFKVVDSPDGAIIQVGRVDLIELGPCLKCANPATVLMSTKSQDEAGQPEAESPDKEDTKDPDPENEDDPPDPMQPDDGLRDLVRQTVLEELASRSAQADRKPQEDVEKTAKACTVPELTAWAADLELHLMEGTL